MDQVSNLNQSPHDFEHHDHAGGAVITADTASAQDLGMLLLNSTGEGISGIGMDGNCTLANPSCLKLLGFESDADVLGKHMHDLVHQTRPNGDPYPVQECRIYQAFLKGEGTHVIDEIMFCADGTNFPAKFWPYPVEHDGEMVGCVVTFVDVTERLKQDEELRLTDKMAALGELFAGLAPRVEQSCCRRKQGIQPTAGIPG